MSFCKILENKWYHAKVLLKRFHLNGHTIGFHPQTQKLELHYMSLQLTLGVKYSKEYMYISTSSIYTNCITYTSCIYFNLANNFFDKS